MLVITNITKRILKNCSIILPQQILNQNLQQGRKCWSDGKGNIVAMCKSGAVLYTWQQLEIKILL